MASAFVMRHRAETRNGAGAPIVEAASHYPPTHCAEMPSYLLYFMNPVSGHIDRQETLHAGDDVAAVHMLQGLPADVPVELWRDGRKVSRQDGPPNRFRDHLLEPAAAAPEPPAG